ncbi:MAG: cell wall hydrolase [Christensenellales bacterium]
MVKKPAAKLNKLLLNGNEKNALPRVLLLHEKNKNLLKKAVPNDLIDDKPAEELLNAQSLESLPIINEEDVFLSEMSESDISSLEQSDQSMPEIKQSPKKKNKSSQQSSGGYTLLKPNFMKGQKNVSINRSNAGSLLFPKVDYNKKASDAALKFAISNTRLGKKGRRKLRIAWLASCVLVVTVFLLVFLVIPAKPANHTDVGTYSVLAQKNGTGGQAAFTLARAAYAYEVDFELSPDNPAIDTEPDLSTPEPSLSAEPTAGPSPTPFPVSMDEMVEAFKVDSKLYYNQVGYSSNHYEYTDDELYMLAQLIHGEARGEVLEGKIAVGNVVMNRVLSRGFPGNDIKSVITASGQFSGYSPSIKPSIECRSAARLVLEKEVWVVPQNVYFFRANAPGTENWGSRTFYKKIDGHYFYTYNYSGRSRSDNIPPRLFERTFKWPQYGCKPEKRVYRIQYMLNKLGYDVYADKYFGEGTKDAIIEFQKKKKLNADGVAGPSTIRALIEAYGKENYYMDFHR